MLLMKIWNLFAVDDGKVTNSGKLNFDKFCHKIDQEWDICCLKPKIDLELDMNYCNTQSNLP